MRIKSKLWFGAVFLYSIILLVGGLGIFYMVRISKASEKIIRDNYVSLEASKMILRNLDELRTIQINWYFQKSAVFHEDSFIFYMDRLEYYLEREEQNITEAGELEAAQSIRENYTLFCNMFLRDIAQNSRNPDFYFSQLDSLYNSILKSVNHVADINMSAIKRKNDEAGGISQRAIMLMSVLATICFLVTFSFVVNFPSLANPIRDLTASIREIANKNYNQRLEYESADEFGELSEAFNSMAEKLQEYESSNLSKLLLEKKRIETIIQSLPDGVIGLDENLGVLFVNSAACAILQLPEQVVAGSKLTESAEKSEVAKEICSDLLAESDDRKINQEKWIKIRLHEQESFFSKEYLEVRSPHEGVVGQKILGFVVLLHDITEFKKLDAAKTNFLATVSHELKTPIATIKMCVKLLEDLRIGMLNEEQTQLAASIRSESERLTRITSELLNLSQIESGKIILQITPVPAKESIRSTMEIMRVLADKKRVKLEAAGNDEALIVMADGNKLEWILLNLVSNALHYSPEGGVVTLGAKRVGNFAEFFVEDRGEGIPGEYLERIFEKYFKVPGVNKDGTGLGLAISREFITAMNGYIHAESEPGKGSRFIFTLPLNNPSRDHS
ncbi:MAG: ATP-binding protein [Bacteroidales bacterium]